MAPRQIVGELHAGNPDIKAGFLEMEAIRWLRDLDLSEAEFERGVDEIRDEVVRLTGSDRTRRPPSPEPPKARDPETDPTELAITLVGAAFSATYDGTETRIQVLSRRAWGKVDHLLERGADRERVARAIESEAQELRSRWTAR